MRSISRVPAATRFFLATRPMFFPASVCPLLLGTAWGVRASGELDALAFALATAATLFVHAGANVLNDVYDDISGTDARNVGYIHPFSGGSRFIQDGVVSRSAMLWFGLLLLALSISIGIALAALKGAAIILLGLVGVGLGVAYSMTPIQLSARGLGEIAVGIAFGILPVMGAAWLQSGAFGLESLLISAAPSFWILNVLLVNEIPDIDADTSVGKRTLPVRWGTKATWALYITSNALAMIAVTIAVGTSLLPPATVVLPSLLLMAALYVTLTLARGGTSRSGLVAAAKTTIAIHIAGTLWLTILVLI